MPEWKIKYYISANGDSPVADYVKTLDNRGRAKVINSVRLLQEFGIQLGGSHTKKLKGTDLWELRILSGDSIRIFYVAVEQRTFLLLHGFTKKTFATPAKEIKTATLRLRDYNSRSQ